MLRVANEVMVPPPSLAVLLLLHCLVSSTKFTWASNNNNNNRNHIINHNNNVRAATANNADRAAANALQQLRNDKSREMRRYMNLTIDPCVDFYEYACGNWGQFHAPSTDTPQLSVQLELETRVNQQLQQLLNEPFNAELDGNGGRKVKEFYQACVTAPSRSDAQRTFHLNFVQRHGGLPALAAATHWQAQHYNWVQVLGMLRANYSLDILLGLEVESNLAVAAAANNRGGGTGGSRIYLNEPVETLLPAELCSAETMSGANIHEERYAQAQREIAANLQRWLRLSGVEAQRMAGDIVSFEFKLCSGMRRTELLPDALTEEEDEFEEEEQTDVEAISAAHATHFAAKAARKTFINSEAERTRTPYRYKRQGGHRRQDGNMRQDGSRRQDGNRRQGVIGQRRYSLQQLTTKYEDLIDFKQYVDLSLSSAYTENVYLRGEAYFAHLASVLRQTSRPTLANYIMYRALSALSLPPDLTAGAASDTKAAAQRRPRHCVQLLQRYLAPTLGDMYSRSRSRRESAASVREDLESLYQQLRRAFEDRLQQVAADWLQANTQRAARQKIAQFKLSFPQQQQQHQQQPVAELELRDLAIERLDVWHKLEQLMLYNARQQLRRLHTGDYGRQQQQHKWASIGNQAATQTAADVHLLPLDNELQVAWPLLQKPYYHLLYAQTLKFSNMGQRLARELVRAFDEQGWHAHPLSPMHWDAYTLEGFRNRSHCFRTQYSNYLYNQPHVFRNASKLRELIADSSGLNIAFHAYLNWLAYMEPTSLFMLLKETLPDLNYSNTQLFFINFAQTRCSASFTQKPSADFLPMDRHTDERYSVNGPLSNSDEFAREFNCAPGTAMNPDDKCVIY